MPIYPIYAGEDIRSGLGYRPRLRTPLGAARTGHAAPVRAGMHGTVTVTDDTVRAGWTDTTGGTLTKEFATEREAVTAYRQIVHRQPTADDRRCPLA